MLSSDIDPWQSRPLILDIPGRVFRMGVPLEKAREEATLILRARPTKPRTKPLNKYYALHREKRIAYSREYYSKHRKKVSQAKLAAYHEKRKEGGGARVLKQAAA